MENKRKPSEESPVKKACDESAYMKDGVLQAVTEQYY